MRLLPAVYLCCFLPFLSCTAAEDPPPPVDLLAADVGADLGPSPDLPSGPVPRERGSLVALVEQHPTTSSLGLYKPPTAAEATLFRDAMALLVEGAGERAAPLLAQVGYTVTDFVDDSFEPAQPRRFYVVRESVGARRYLGLYILRRDDAPRRHIFIEAPFGYDSFLEYLRHQAVRTLLAADIGGILLNTADRCTNSETQTSCIKCAGTCLRCRAIDRSYFPVSDQGHAEGTFFQVAHEAISADPRSVVLSIHGHADSTAGYVVSDGTKVRAAADAPVHRLGRAYGSAAGVSVRSCNDGTSTTLCGDTLLQGRQLNGYAPLCTGLVPQGPRRFLALQQLYEVRRADGTAGPGTRTILAAAILAAFP